MEFAAIDFETANEQRSSPCSVGVVVTRNGETISSYHTLIKPRGCRFTEYNCGIHGITPDDVRDKPEFPEIWPLLRDFLESNVVLAHNASFDMSVLRATLSEYEIDFPEIKYGCTRLIAKSAWPGLISYRLALVTRLLGIEFQHHDALEDANACARIVCRAGRETESQSLDELAERLEFTFGAIHSSGDYCPPSGCYRAGNRNGSRIDIRSIKPLAVHRDPNRPFFAAAVAFTGTLKSMGRKDAMQAVVDKGGDVETGVTKRTCYLVVGDQDYRQFAEGCTKSSKMRKAEALLADGQDIEIIAEEDFLQMLGV